MKYYRGFSEEEYIKQYSQLSLSEYSERIMNFPPAQQDYLLQAWHENDALGDIRYLFQDNPTTREARIDWLQNRYVVTYKALIDDAINNDIISLEETVKLVKAYKSDYEILPDDAIILDEIITRDEVDDDIIAELMVKFEQSSEKEYYYLDHPINPDHPIIGHIPDSDTQLG